MHAGAQSTPSAQSTPAEDGTSSSKAGKVATDAVYAGLKLTGLALNVASDIASSLRRDAEKALQTTDSVVAVKVRRCGSWRSMWHLTLPRLFAAMRERRCKRQTASWQ